MSGLAGRTLLLTRTREQNDADARLVHQRGAKALSFPGIRIAPPASWDACDAAIIRLRSYDSVVFTSANAVKAFVGRIDAVAPPARDVLRRRRAYAAGQKTAAALEAEGLPVTGALEAGTADDLAASMGDVAGRTILFPKSEIARDALPSALRTRDATVHEVVVYRTLPPERSDLEEARNAIRGGHIDALVFFSPSALWNVIQMIGTVAIRGIPVAVIGPTTAEAAKRAGLPVDLVSSQTTIESLLDSLEQYFQHRSES